ncbi:MAG: pentapeptide repeat-containing protein, partial [Myxococcales bacterium]|nr:pentapeptide repeat-containing protein [Myxococcales bacterium]
VDLRGADLSGMNIHRGAFINCPASGAKFEDAILDSIAFVEKCPLDGASFVRATMPRCNLRGQILDGADFSHATLDSADLSETSLIGAKFYRAVAREARFVRANLDGASLLAANLMQAVFTHAIITGVDLRGANLYAADMARVQSDERVRLDDALLTKVRINPRYHEPAVERDQT